MTSIDALASEYQPAATTALDRLLADLSALPPHVLFLVGRDAIAASLPQAFAALPNDVSRMAVAHFSEWL